MKIKHRLGLFAAGGLIMAYGMSMWHRYGVFPYLNRYRTGTFPIAVVVTGLVFVALAFLPPARWVYRLISTKPRREGHVFNTLDRQRCHRPGSNRLE